MTADIQNAARRLLDVIDAPRGVVGVVAWPDIVLPSIRVFVVAGIRLPISAVPTEFEGFPVEVVTRGDAMPFHNEATASLERAATRVSASDPNGWLRNLLNK